MDLQQVFKQNWCFLVQTDTDWLGSKVFFHSSSRREDQRETEESSVSATKENGREMAGGESFDINIYIKKLFSF